LNKVLVSAVTLIVLTAPVHAFEPAIPNVFIYRVYAEPTPVAATVKINGMTTTKLSNRDYLQDYYPPGRYKVAVTWPWWTGRCASETTITVRDDSEHYLRIGGTNRQAHDGEKCRAGQDIDEATGAGISEVPSTEGAAEVHDLVGAHFVR
jgi:hypothetical protein